MPLRLLALRQAAEALEEVQRCFPERFGDGAAAELPICRLADGQPLRLRQEDIVINRHAIECRINAEDPQRNFIPSAGKITALNLPGGPGVRIDSHIYQGYEISPYYDSLLAKVIAYGQNREDAMAKMRRVLGEFTGEGVASTIPFHRALLEEANFIAGKFNTDYVANTELPL